MALDFKFILTLKLIVDDTSTTFLFVINSYKRIRKLNAWSSYKLMIGPYSSSLKTNSFFFNSLELSTYAAMIFQFAIFYSILYPLWKLKIFISFGYFLTRISATIKPLLMSLKLFYTYEHFGLHKQGLNCPATL